MGEGNKKLSKRDPESNLFLYRDAGFLPEGLLNYLALLGWAIADDRDVFTLDEMVAAFDIVDVNPNPARFDLKKAEAINAAHIRLLGADDFADAAARRTSTPTATTPAWTTRGFAEAARAGADAHRRARRRVGPAEVPRRRRPTRSTRSPRPRS